MKFRFAFCSPGQMFTCFSFDRFMANPAYLEKKRPWGRRTILAQPIWMLPYLSLPVGGQSVPAPSLQPIVLGSLPSILIESNTGRGASGILRGSAKRNIVSASLILSGDKKTKTGIVKTIFPKLGLAGHRQQPIWQLKQMTMMLPKCSEQARQELQWRWPARPHCRARRLPIVSKTLLAVTSGKAVANLGQNAAR